MSARVLKWAKAQKIDDATLRSVLIALADAADTSSHTCGLSQPQIAARSGLKERATRSALALLESLQLIRRQSPSAVKIHGRLPDLITFAMDRTFVLDRETIRHIRMGPSGSKCRMVEDESNRHIVPHGPLASSGTVPVGPKPSRVEVDIYPGDWPSDLSINARVVWEESRRKWRARFRYESVELDLGRFDSKEEAQAECRVAVLDLIHTSQNRSGIPRSPRTDLDVGRLMGAERHRFLDDETLPEITRSSATVGRGEAPRPTRGDRDLEGKSEF